jgi:hypothetical protein
MTNVQVVVDIELDTDDSPEELKKALLGELVKVKSGPYENWAMGDIVEVRQLPNKARRRGARVKQGTFNRHMAASLWDLSPE